MSAGRWADELRTDPGKPETRFATVVGKGQDSDDALPIQVDHVIWEAVHWPASRGYIIRNIQDTLADRRPTSDLIKRGVDGLDELDTKPGALLLVPESRVFKFGRGFGFWPEPLVHRSASRRRTRARTSSHGSPADSPDMTSRARLSISRAQAASTAARSDGGPHPDWQEARRRRLHADPPATPVPPEELLALVRSSEHSTAEHGSPTRAAPDGRAAIVSARG